MNKELKWFSASANCGNHLIGENACKVIVDQLNQSQADWIVINCQEVNFKQTQQQLEKALGANSGYRVKLLGSMSTHTKPTEQLHHNTGMASYVIHKNNLTIQVKDRIQARRNESRFSGAGYNKGGLVVNFSVTDPLKQTIKLQTISGHLDSKNTSTRIVDWANIHYACEKTQVKSWGELVDALPAIRTAGYDANTRNTLDNNIWEAKIVPQELKVFQQAALGATSYSKESTYKTSHATIMKDPDPKRPGYVRGGMLDFVTVSMDDKTVNLNSSHNIIQNDVISIGSEVHSKRDHNVVISPLQVYNPQELSEFQRVKNQMINRLAASAPEVAETIRGLPTDSKDKLCEIYNLYLSKNGLLITQIKLQAKLLEQINKIIKIDPYLGEKISAVIFPDRPWFSDTLIHEDTFKNKQTLEQEISDVLSCCETRMDLDTVHQELSHSPQNQNFSKKPFRDMIARANMKLVAEIRERCIEKVETFFKKMDQVTQEQSEPKFKTGTMLAEALELTGYLHSELKLLQQANISKHEKLYISLQSLLSTLLKNVMKLFSSIMSLSKTTQSVTSQQLDEAIHIAQVDSKEQIKQSQIVNHNMVGFSEFKAMNEKQKQVDSTQDQPERFTPPFDR